MNGVHLTAADGQLYPTSDVDWVYYAPCGCVAGWMRVDSDSVTVEQAWKRFNRYTDPDLTKRDQALGARMELHPRSALPELTRGCPHEPKWGVPERPTLAGHTWLVNEGHGARLSDKAHLFNDETKRSVCNAHDNPWGKFQAFAVESHLPCGKCVADVARISSGAAA